MSRSSPKSHTPTHRLERVGELIRHAMAEILARGDVLDDALERHPVTVLAVRMSPDLKVADHFRDAARRPGRRRDHRRPQSPQEGTAAP